MERRWAKIALKPDVKKLRDFLTVNRAPSFMFGPVIAFFNGLQKYLEIGHAFFRAVKDADSLSRLWENQLQYIIKKRFRFDTETQREIEALWATCEAAIKPPASATQASAPVGAAGRTRPIGAGNGGEPASPAGPTVGGAAAPVDPGAAV
jgi:5-methylcytosine-specific restriction protein B